MNYVKNPNNFNFSFDGKIQLNKEIVDNSKINEKKVVNNKEVSLISKFQFLFNDTIKDISLIHEGLDKNEFFMNCRGKNNLLFLVKDDNGDEFGGFMSVKFINHNDEGEKILRDSNAFIFNLGKKIKFKVIKEDYAINILDGYLICFGGSSKLGNDFYICDDDTGGMNRIENYGDKRRETINYQNIFNISELKVYHLNF